MGERASSGGNRIANGTPTTRRWLRLPTEQAAWLAAEATARGVSESLLVARALDHYRMVLPPRPAGPLDVEDLEQMTAALDELAPPDGRLDA